MKFRFFLFSVLLIGSFAAASFAGPGCDSCATEAAHEEKEQTTEVKASEACPDGVCATDAHEHKADKVDAATDVPATINTLGLKTLINSGAPLTILDARSGEFDDGRRIAGAIALNAESKAEEIAKVLPNKEALIVTYCSNVKCPASHKLYTHLRSLGYTNLIEYPEGIQGWVEAGNPVTSAK